MRIAVVGAGISGLLAAYVLGREHEVTLFEAEDRLGGHTHTVDVTEPDGTVRAVDTGFIVFNDWTYPTFIRLLDHLGVAWQPSDMSFAVSCAARDLEYNGTSLDTLFAQRRNLVSPRFLRMVRDILRFHREAPRVLEQPEDGQTLGQMLAAGRYSDGFVQDYIVPMGAAIWSADPATMFGFPARFFVRFFANRRGAARTVPRAGAGRDAGGAGRALRDPRDRHAARRRATAFRRGRAGLPRRPGAGAPGRRRPGGARGAVGLPLPGDRRGAAGTTCGGRGTAAAASS